MRENGVPRNSLDDYYLTYSVLPNLSDSFWPYRSTAIFSLEDLDVSYTRDVTSESGTLDPKGAILADKRHRSPLHPPPPFTHKDKPCSYKTCGAKPPRRAGLLGLCLCLLPARPKGPDREMAMTRSLRPVAAGPGLRQPVTGRAALVQRGRPG
ncbi:hypothetical protein Celaphus_00002099 [Cervus elaphus hippelaphus]|uniref:Olduvai domain-containing protein n=1 Tax=Cervus elaphus hippelaphus TaxID=46360 RepID=A0A212CGT9_CEREH|nr:hypothetical protein Celaphus_00002099 [Cervus elaphus hippelaphus]